MIVTSFPPVVSPKSTVLILGSMPGTISLRMQQYYAHPRNYFWRIIEDLTGVPAEAPYSVRVERLRETGIALWDSLEACERPGSLDASIVVETERPNDFAELLKTHAAIRALCFNGKKSEQVLRKRVISTIPTPYLQRLELIGLPSTSPANASLTYEQKLARWRVIVEYLPGGTNNHGR